MELISCPNCGSDNITNTDIHLLFKCLSCRVNFSIAEDKDGENKTNQENKEVWEVQL